MDFVLDTLLQRPLVVGDHFHENATQIPAIDAFLGSSLIQEPITRSTMWLIGVPVVLGLWAVLCSSFRFRNEKAMLRRFNYPTRASLAKMTNDDAQQIVHSLLNYEFPLMFEMALKFALFKAPKRLEDSLVIFSEFSNNPPTSERAIAAIARMNHLHTPFRKAGKIKERDLIYTLAVCTIEPIRFVKFYDYRPLNDMEICAIGTFWKSIGDAMEIDYKGYLAQEEWKDGIEFVEDITAWSKQYEVDDMKPHKANKELADTLVGMLFSFIPAPDFMMQVMTCIMGDRVREAFMYPQPGIFACLVTFATLSFRRFLVRYFCLPRLRPRDLFSDPDPKTGRIRHFEYVLQPYYNPPTFWSRWGPMALFFRMVGGEVPGSSGLLPEGFLPTDLGPRHQMGKGGDAMKIDMARMRETRPSGSPFSTHLA